jgi:hypothetical protein
MGDEESEPQRTRRNAEEKTEEKTENKTRIGFERE